MSIEIKVPVLPESVEDATIATWHKNVGDTVEQDEVIVEVETDKVMLEVPAETDGKITEILFKEGEQVTAEQVLGTLEAGSFAPAPVAEKAEPTPESTKNQQSEKPAVTEKVAGPAARKIMADKKIDPKSVSGSGKDGRILKEDVAGTTAKKVDNQPVAAEPRLVERVPMSRLRQTVAKRLLSASQETAMLTTFNELDMQAVLNIRSKYKEQFEKTHGVRLGFMSFFVKAAVEALKKFPAVNAYIDGEDIVYHAYCDIGVAVASERGLVVPVIKDAQNMQLHEMEKTIGDFAERAQAGKLTLDEITGGTFTVSNGGVFGSMLSTPILNPPQSAILGMHKTQERPVVVDGEIVIRPIMYLALSYDHRIIDGKEAVLFLRSIKESLEDPARLLLDL